MTLEMIPQRVARSVVGHLLASAKVEQDKTGSSAPPMHRAMRDYFMNPDHALPISISIYVWPYFATRQVIIPVFAKGRLGVKRSIFGSLLKFYPLAFWLVYDPDRTPDLPLAQLVPRHSTVLNEVRDLVLPLQHIPPVGWPETPGRSDIIILTTAGSSLADPIGDLGASL
jgi:hypothetical protein